MEKMNIFKHSIIVGFLGMNCTIFPYHQFPIDKPACYFQLKNSQDKVYTYKNPVFELKVRLKSFACNAIDVSIELSSNQNLSLAISNLKIIYKEREVEYQSKFYGESDNCLKVETKSMKNLIRYYSEFDSFFKEGEEITIFAEDFIGNGDEYFNLDTLTFTVSYTMNLTK
jgi:hypothetical protein